MSDAGNGSEWTPAGRTVPSLGPVYSAITGADYGESVRHGIAREAFLEHFLEDERVQALYKSWARRSGIGAAVGTVHAMAKSFANLVDGLPDWRLVFTDLELEVDNEAELQQLERLQADITAAVDRLGELIVESEGLDLPREAEQFVMALELPWPWLSLSLILHFYERIVGDIQGLRYVHRLHVYPVDPPAPSLEIHFATEPGETVSRALGRLEDEIERAREQLRAAIPPRGRIPDKTRDSLRRWTRWFYLAKVPGVPIQTIARREFDHAPENRRTEIRDRIVEVERLLDLTPYTYRD